MTKKAECAKCGRVLALVSRGLCWKCRKDEIEAGTIDENYPAKRKGKWRTPAPPEKTGTCANPNCGKAGKLVPETGLCPKCHAAKLREDLGLDTEAGQPGEEAPAPAPRKITAQAVYDYIRDLEAKLEASERAYRKLRRSVLASLSAAQDDLLRQEGADAVGKSFMEHHKPDGSVEVYEVPEEAMGISGTAGEPIRMEAE